MVSYVRRSLKALLYFTHKNFVTLFLLIGILGSPFIPVFLNTSPNQATLAEFEVSGCGPSPSNSVPPPPPPSQESQEEHCGTDGKQCSQTECRKDDQTGNCVGTDILTDPNSTVPFCDPAVSDCQGGASGNCEGGNPCTDNSDLLLKDKYTASMGSIGHLWANVLALFGSLEESAHATDLTLNFCSDDSKWTSSSKVCCPLSKVYNSTYCCGDGKIANGYANGCITATPATFSPSPIPLTDALTPKVSHTQFTNYCSNITYNQPRPGYPNTVTTDGTGKHFDTWVMCTCATDLVTHTCEDFGKSKFPPSSWDSQDRKVPGRHCEGNIHYNGCSTANNCNPSASCTGNNCCCKYGGITNVGFKTWAKVHEDMSLAAYNQIMSTPIPTSSATPGNHSGIWIDENNKVIASNMQFAHNCPASNPNNVPCKTLEQIQNGQLVTWAPVLQACAGACANALHPMDPSNMDAVRQVKVNPLICSPSPTPSASPSPSPSTSPAPLPFNCQDVDITFDQNPVLAGGTTNLLVSTLSRPLLQPSVESTNVYAECLPDPVSYQLDGSVNWVLSGSLFGSPTPYPENSWTGQFQIPTTLLGDAYGNEDQVIYVRINTKDGMSAVCPITLVVGQGANSCGGL